MEAKYLIYPCVFSEDEFNSLRSVESVVNELFMEVSVKEQKLIENINHYLAKALTDLKEIVNNKNCKGYRYNSYLLNMVELKLTYVYELMRKVDVSRVNNQLSKISEAIYITGLILDSSYRNYLDGVQ